ncbi:MAG TPA: hypothetical protein H9766_03910, partial [Candidatus Dorea faecigallinarum]|nr:hypothetical protein [Candidatus Dorea faecigallinarum]
VAKVRRYAKEMALAEAVERAITECIQEGILADFLERNRAEVKKEMNAEEIADMLGLDIETIREVMEK